MKSKQGLVIYEVQSGDTFDKVITETYGAVSVPRLLQLQKHILSQNNYIKKPSELRSGHVLVFDLAYEGNQSCSLSTHSSNNIRNEIKCLSKKDKEIFFPLVENNVDWFQASGLGVTFSTSTSVKINQFVRSNEDSLRELIRNYEAFAKGKITKYNYEKARIKLLSDFKLFTKKTFHINTSAAKSYRAIINSPGSRFTGFDSHIAQMARTSKLLSRAPLVGQLYDVGTTSINAVGAYQVGGGKAAGYEIVGGVGSILGGFLGSKFISAATGYVLLTGPAGWGVAVVIGLGAVGGSYIVQEKLQKVYKNLID